MGATLLQRRFRSTDDCTRGTDTRSMPKTEIMLTPNSWVFPMCRSQCLGSMIVAIGPFDATNGISAVNSRKSSAMSDYY